MKNLTLILSIVFLSSCFVACSSDDDEGKQTLSETKFVPVKFTSGEDYINLTYDAQHRVTEIKSHFLKYKESEDLEINLTYNDEGIAQKLTYQFDNRRRDEISFTYNKDSVFVTNSVYENNDLVLIINEKGMPVKSIFSHEREIYHMEYDTNDRLVKRIYNVYDYKSEDFEGYSISKFEYDDKKGIGSAINMPYWLRYYICNHIYSVYYPLQADINNMVKLHVENLMYHSVSTTDIKYEYNANGYPSSYISTSVYSSSQRVETWTVEYEEAN